MQFGPRWIGDSEREDLMVFCIFPPLTPPTPLPTPLIMKIQNHQPEWLIETQKDVSENGGEGGPKLKNIFY